MFVIMLKPVLMEHEGRHHVMKIMNTEAEAKAWITAQEGEYFSPSDYYITKPLEA